MKESLSTDMTDAQEYMTKQFVQGKVDLQLGENTISHKNDNNNTNSHSNNNK